MVNWCNEVVGEWSMPGNTDTVNSVYRFDLDCSTGRTEIRVFPSIVDLPTETTSLAGDDSQSAILSPPIVHNSIVFSNILRDLPQCFCLTNVHVSIRCTHFAMVVVHVLVVLDLTVMLPELELGQEPLRHHVGKSLLIWMIWGFLRQLSDIDPVHFCLKLFMSID